MKSDNVMSEEKIRRWMAAFGIAGFIVFLAAMPLYFLGPPAVMPQDAGFIDYVTKTSSYIVARAGLADPLLISCFLVFLAGYHHLIRQARSDYEWVSTLVLGAGLLYIILQLVGDALQTAGALAATSGADYSAVRALFEGSAPLYSAIGLIPEAFFFAFVGYTTLGTKVLPKWTGWIAYAGAIITFANAPAIYLGFNGLIYAGPAGLVAAVAEFWAPIWALVTSISLIQKRDMTWSS